MWVEVNEAQPYLPIPDAGKMLLALASPADHDFTAGRLLQSSSINCLRSQVPHFTLWNKASWILAI